MLDIEPYRFPWKWKSRKGAKPLQTRSPRTRKSHTLTSDHQNKCSRVDWDCIVLQLHLCRGVRLPHETPVFDIKQSDDEAPVMREVWGMWSTSTFSITLRSILTRNGSTWKSPIYWSNRTVWCLNWQQTNDLW